MILQALVKHYEDLLERGEITSGWEKVRVSFGLNLDRNGNLISIEPLRVEKEKGKKKVYEPQTLVVPMRVNRSRNIRPNFLCDNATYMLGINEKEKPERTRQCFEAFRDLHLRLLQDVDSVYAGVIVQFLQKWEPEKAKEYDCIVENWKDIINGANLLFYCEEDMATEDKTIKQCWQKYYDTADDEHSDEQYGICMVTGQKTQIAREHPLITGVYGAQPMGTYLVSFHEQAFWSYGKKEGNNASVGKYAAVAYGAALNHLLSDREHVRHIGDTTIVCWAEGGDKAYQDVAMAAMFGAQEESGITNTDLIAILNAAIHGSYVEWNNQVLDMDRHFYILGLTPNTARLLIRFIWQDSFGNMLRNIGKHYERLEMVKPAFDKRDKLTVKQLLYETERQNVKDKDPASQMEAETKKQKTGKDPVSQMEADVIMAILKNGPYPATLLNKVMQRIRAEQYVSRGRAAIIKAYYLRNLQNKNEDTMKEVLQVQLNEESVNVPYNLGRLFAVLEYIQKKASPEINATIKDKYFNAAAETPAHIFPLLIKLTSIHLRKLDERNRIAFSKKQEEIMSKFGEEYPARLTLPQQGSFYLGYYHQTQKFYEKKEDK